MILTPEYIFRNVEAIRPEFLAQLGVRALVLDVDNTLTGDGSQQLDASVQAWLDAMRAAGIQDVTLKLYRGGRHEIINETNRAEVYEDILTWCNGHV